MTTPPLTDILLVAAVLYAAFSAVLLTASRAHEVVMALPERDYMHRQPRIVTFAAQVFVAIALFLFAPVVSTLAYLEYRTAPSPPSPPPASHIN